MEPSSDEVASTTAKHDKGRKNGEREVSYCEESDGNGQSDGYRLVDRNEEYDGASEKQEY